MLDRKKTIEAGWTQCSIFNYISSPYLYEIIPANLRDEQNYYVVLSHPCSLLNSDLEIEPDLEIAVAIPIGQIDGNCTHGKNPRKLHVCLTQLNQSFELEQKNRCVISRKHIDKCTPTIGKLESSVARAICTWVINRYISSAFPDNFETRISKNKSKLRKLFANPVGQKCRAVYITLNESLRDLDEDENYELRVFFTLSTLDYQDYDREYDEPNNAYKDFLDKLTLIFQHTNGITLLNATFLDDSKLTVAQVQNPAFMKWNFDFISIASNSEIDQI